MHAAPSITVSVEVSGGMAIIGESYSMTCLVSGAELFHPTITYQWMQDGAVVNKSSSSSLSFLSLNMSHVGQYSCHISLSSPLLQNHIIATSNSYTFTPQSKYGLHVEEYFDLYNIILKVNCCLVIAESVMCLVLLFFITPTRLSSEEIRG